MARGHNGDLWSFAGASLRSKRGLDGTVGLNNSRAWPPLLTTRILGIVVASELHRSGWGSYGALDMTCRSLWMRAGRGMRQRRPVLVIDDDPRSCELITAILTRVGFEVRSAPDGASGIKLAGIVQPIVILLDMRSEEHT